MDGEREAARARAGEARRRRGGLLLAVAGALLIGALTLSPHPEDAAQVGRTPFTCVLCGDLFAVDFLLNIALFVPFGLGLRLAGVGRARAQLCALAATVAVECLQGLALVGRHAALGDLISNSLGGALGIALAECGAGTLLRTGLGRSRALAASAALLWFALSAAVGWLLQPSWPAGRWYSQLPPQGIYREDFRGQIAAASLNGRALRSAELAPSEPLRRELLRSGAELQARARLGPPPAQLVGLVSLNDDDGHELLLLGQRRTDLVFRARTHAADFGLRTPALRLAGCAAGGTGAPLEARGSLQGGVLRLSGSGAQPCGSAALTLSPNWGWSLLLPYEYALGPEVGALSALWLAGLALPLGYWGRRAQGSGARGCAGLSAALALAAAAVLGGVPALFGMAPARWIEWLGAAAGVGAGWQLARLALRRERGTG